VTSVSAPFARRIALETVSCPRSRISRTCSTERRLVFRSRRLARREVDLIQYRVSSPDWGANNNVNPTPTPKPIIKPTKVRPFVIVFSLLARRLIAFCVAPLCSHGRFRIGLHFNWGLFFDPCILSQQKLSHVDSDEMRVHIHPCVRRFSFLPRFRRKKEFSKSAAYGVRH